MIQFQYYINDIKKTIPIGIVTINGLIKAIRNPNKKMYNVYNEIQQCEIIGNNKRKAELKEHLYYFIAPTISDGKGRGYKNIVKFTGALQLDFDHIDNASQFRDDLFNKYDFIIAAWLSASKKGVKALVSIPISENVDEFKSYFWGLANNEMSQYIGFDKSPQNAVLALFISYDKNIKYRKNYTTWTKIGVNPSMEKYGKTTELRFKIESNDKYTNAAIHNTKKAINGILDNGHPQVRGAGMSLGGYIGAGYLFKSDAINLITGLIKANAYLSKGTDGYIKTAIQMINRGENTPLFFDF